MFNFSEKTAELTVTVAGNASTVSTQTANTAAPSKETKDAGRVHFGAGMMRY
jgi:hypothetical protein